MIDLAVDMFWNTIHVGTGIICACLPIYRPLGRACTSFFSSKLSSLRSKGPSEGSSKLSSQKTKGGSELSKSESAQNVTWIALGDDMDGHEDFPENFSRHDPSGENFLVREVGGIV
jgi:hypothetical protein